MPSRASLPIIIVTNVNIISVNIMMINNIIIRDGVLSAHQCLLEPLSPLLSTLFQQHNCCNCRSGSSAY